MLSWLMESLVPDSFLGHVLCLPIYVYLATRLYVYGQYQMLTLPRRLLINLVPMLNTKLAFKDHEWVDLDRPTQEVLTKRREAFGLLMASVTNLAAPLNLNSDDRFSLGARFPARFVNSVPEETLQEGITLERVNNNELLVKCKDGDNASLMDVGGAYGVNIVGQEKYQVRLAAAVSHMNAVPV